MTGDFEGLEEVMAPDVRCEATFSGESPMVPIPPTGRRTGASGTHVCHWSGGVVVEAWHHGDWLSWLQGAGVIPALG